MIPNPLLIKMKIHMLNLERWNLDPLILLINDALQLMSPWPKCNWVKDHVPNNQMQSTNSYKLLSIQLIITCWKETSKLNWDAMLHEIKVLWSNNIPNHKGRWHLTKTCPLTNIHKEKILNKISILKIDIYDVWYTMYTRHVIHCFM